jgi:hypothetical protein
MTSPERRRDTVQLSPRPKLHCCSRNFEAIVDHPNSVSRVRPFADLCRNHGKSDSTFYAWKSKCRGPTVSDAARLSALEEENRRLKKLLAESMLDVSAWQYDPLRGKDEPIRERMREIANERRWFSYLRQAILLKLEGKGMNLKKVYRLFRETRLTVHERGARKCALAPMAISQEPINAGRSTVCRMH